MNNHAGRALGGRRHFLICAGTAFAGACAGVVAASPIPRKRTLALASLHTGETLDVTYWAAGSYIDSALARVNRILRDHRTGEMTSIDVGLLDLLYTIRSELSASEPFQVISGFRSPRTNARLRAQGRGVAKQSLHMVGKAADVRLSGVRLGEIRDVGLRMRRGGVGYYESEFVHVDVGRVRSW